MNSKRRISVVQPRGIKEGHYAGHQCVVRQEEDGSPAYCSETFYSLRQSYQCAEIHGYGTQLKRDITPLICSAVQNKGQRELFPDLACHKQQSDSKVKSILFFFFVRKFRVCHSFISIKALKSPYSSLTKSTCVQARHEGVSRNARLKVRLCGRPPPRTACCQSHRQPYWS